MNSTAEIVLQLNQITKQFGSFRANDAIDLELYRGEVLALLGENGAGKTTLMNILFGHYLADQGAIAVFGKPLPLGSPRAALKAGIGMVHQHFTLADNLSALDNITLGTEPLWQLWQNRQLARRRLLQLVETFGLAINPDARVGDLSVGERQRIEILKALYRQVKILILDEPTAVLTPQETEGLFATLRKLVQAGLSVVFISHKLQEVMAVSDRVVVLRAGQVVATVPTAETTPAQLAELMVGKPIPKVVREPLPIGKPVLQLTNIAVKTGDGRSPLQSANLTVHQHEIVGIAGVSGNGQATLFDLISGLLQPTSGMLHLYGKPCLRLSPTAMVQAGIARIPEDRHATGLVADMNIWENLILATHHPAFSRSGLVQRSQAMAYADSIISTYDVRCSSAKAQVRVLSGGNMQKLILGRELSHQPQLILASQPTRGLDLGAVSYVHQQLLSARSQGAGILLISEDLEELLGLSDRIHVIYKGQISEAISPTQVSVPQIGLMMAGK